MNLLYLYINLGALSLPLIFSFHPRIRFYRQWRHAWPAILLPMILFLPWDALFTKMGVWGFNPAYLIGSSLYNLPLEEVLFFVCIPYACLFTYYCFNMKPPPRPARQPLAHLLPMFLFATVGITFLKNAYTSVTFLLLAAFQLISFLWFRGNITRFYMAYAVLLIPFFIVNGLLTGAGIPGEVVWYNNTENLGLRLHTIPVEDVFYGMLLIQMNVFIFEYLRQRGAMSTAGTV